MSEVRFEIDNWPKVGACYIMRPSYEQEITVRWVLDTINDPVMKGPSYMRVTDTNIVEVNYWQPVDAGSTLCVPLICKVVLYSRI